MIYDSEHEEARAAMVHLVERVAAMANMEDDEERAMVAERLAAEAIALLPRVRS